MSLLLGATSTPVGGFRNGMGFLLGRAGNAILFPATIFPDFADTQNTRAVSYGLIAVNITPG